MCASHRDPNEPAESSANHAAFDPAGPPGPHEIFVHRVREEIVIRGPLTERELRDVADLRGANAASLEAASDKALTAEPAARSQHHADAERSELIYDQAVDERGQGRLRDLVRRGIGRKPQTSEVFEQLEATMKEIQDLRHHIQEQESLLKQDNERLKAENRRLHRVVGLSTSICLFVVVILIFMYMGAPLWAVIGAFVGLAAIGFEGVKWLRDPNVSASRFIFAMGATIAWTLLAGILGVVLSASAAPHTARDPLAHRTSHAAASVAHTGLQDRRR
jgi:hypothetical protein